MAERVGLARRGRACAAVAAAPPRTTTTIENVRPRGVAARDALADLVDVERALGDEDDIGAARDPRVRGDPARVAAHDLDDDHAVVRLGRRVQAVDRVGRDLHRGVEAEREVGPARSLSIVFGTPTTGTPSRRQPPRDARACPRRRSGSARRCARASSVARTTPCRPRRPCTGSCATCRGSSRRGAGCPPCSSA